MADPVSSTLLAVCLVAALVRIATFRQPRWNIVSTVALATMLLGLLGLIVFWLGGHGWWSWLFGGGELGSTPSAGP